MTAPQPGSLLRSTSAYVPGLVLVGIGVALSMGAASFLLGVSPLIIALLLGVLIANIGIDLSRFSRGFSLASRPLLRAGIVLLGLKVTLVDIFELGPMTLIAVVVCVAATFGITLAMGRVLKVSTTNALLMASGFSICGASAVVAMDGVVNAKDEDVTAAVAAVTIFGLICVIILPGMQPVLGLSDNQIGLWAGLSVHEVAQVVATAAVSGPDALAVAVSVKLGRVLMLAPIIAFTALALGSRMRDDRIEGQQSRPPLVPLFVLGFIAMVLLTSLLPLPPVVLTVADVLQTILMSAAMFAIGASVRLARLIRSSGRLLALGAISTTALVALSLIFVMVIG